jgi:predicted RNA-binding Zn-ribbon protein involved in translation (DUF1610 family)
MWLVSLVFASFLVGFGGRVIADLPKLQDSLTLDAFVSDPAALATLRSTQTRMSDDLRERNNVRAQAQLEATNAANAYAGAQAQFRNWVSTRVATTDPAQDVELTTRTRALDRLKDQQRTAELAVEQSDRVLLDLQQSLEANRRTESAMMRAAEGAYDKARRGQELHVFLVRLAVTLPLLVIAGILVARQRRADYWPLMRGFVLFAVFTFFVELVPYLPSYGGYVRYGAGIISTAIAGHYVIRSMRRYLARRQEVERQTETERRQSLQYEDALKKMGAKVCPGCERPIQTTGDTAANFCVHCGMTLFDHCQHCQTRKNVFFKYCPSCGTNAPGAGHPA